MLGRLGTRGRAAPVRSPLEDDVGETGTDGALLQGKARRRRKGRDPLAPVDADDAERAASTAASVAEATTQGDEEEDEERAGGKKSKVCACSVSGALLFTPCH
jgi:hypothetical protein